VRPRTGGGGGVGPGSGGLRSTLRSDAPPPERQGGPRGQVQPDVPGGVRLNKRLADQGLCSRREADDWIARGWVTVDGVVAVMGQLVAPRSRVEVLPQARQSQEDRVTILLHKPVGYVSGQPEDGHESAAVLISPRSRWKDDHSPRRFQAQHTRGLAPAGRLDIDSTGLLVLTQDGRVARTIIGEDSEIEKEYLVRVHHVGLGPDAHPSAPLATEDVQSVFPAEQLARLRHGLSLDGQALRPAQVDWQNPEQLRFVLTEGKKRQIRRMCEQVGLHVVGLKRVRIGHITLGQLPVGQWRYLLPNERF
jgi:23S rRNA pseudouridine2604 synthase